jgi:hypothetical protein
MYYLPLFAPEPIAKWAARPDSFVVLGWQLSRQLSWQLSWPTKLSDRSPEFLR